MFIDSGKILGVLGKEPPLMTTKEGPKVDKARDEQKKLIAQDLMRTKPIQEDSQYPILLLGLVIYIMRLRTQLAGNVNGFKSNKAIQPFLERN